MKGFLLDTSVYLVTVQFEITIFYQVLYENIIYSFIVGLYLMY